MTPQARHLFGFITTTSISRCSCLPSNLFDFIYDLKGVVHKTPYIRPTQLCRGAIPSVILFFVYYCFQPSKSLPLCCTLKTC